MAIDDAQGDTRDLQTFALHTVMVHAEFGDVDAAVAILKHSLQTPYGATVGSLRFDHVWTPIRKDPRFQALLASPRG